jgi:Flp pilus assembly protein TadB
LGTLERFLIRGVLSLVFAALISRFFFPEGSVLSVLGLAGVLLGLAYCLEYLRKRNERENYGK